jgi:hypothetical protein
LKDPEGEEVAITSVQNGILTFFTSTSNNCASCFITIPWGTGEMLARN